MKKIRKSFDFSDFLCSIKMKLLMGKWGVMVVILLGLPCITLAQKQKVTINVKEVDVQIVFKQIKEQTNLNFVISRCERFQFILHVDHEGRSFRYKACARTTRGRPLMS